MARKMGVLCGVLISIAAACASLPTGSEIRAQSSSREQLQRIRFNGNRQGKSIEPSVAMTAAAVDFLDAMYLEPTLVDPSWSDRKPNLNEKAKALKYIIFNFDSPNRFEWDYFPPTFRPRQGQPLSLMTERQQELALNLLKSSLSQKGFRKAEAIRRLEEVQRQNESIIDDSLQVKEPGIKDPRLWTWRIGRDPMAYYVTFFGTPDRNNKWGWRFEGHHLSLHWTIENGTVIASTPQFFGSTPSTVRSAGQTERILEKEEVLARDLVESISKDGDATKRQQAEIGQPRQDDPFDIVTGNSPNSRARLIDAGQDDKGIAYSRLNEEQKKILRDLVIEYANAQPELIASERIRKIEEIGWNEIKFAWIGNFEPNTLLYYRIQGKTFLIEYDSFVSPEHQHTVWRDLQGDWGGSIKTAQGQAGRNDYGHDLLMQHYQTASHHAADRARFAVLRGTHHSHGPSRHMVSRVHRKRRG